MGRKKKFTVEELETKWAEYKEFCDNHTVTRAVFSKKQGDFIERSVKAPISYNVEGFCLFLGLSRSNYYKTYGESKQYQDIVTRVREEAEHDTQVKFEVGMIDPRLAALWLGRYGWTANQRSPSDKDDEGVKQFMQQLLPKKQHVEDLWNDEEG